MTDEVLARLMSKVRWAGAHWLWKRSTTGGYATLKITGEKRYAHLELYRHYVGPVPQGKVLKNCCGIRHCVLPWHWEPRDSANNHAEMRRQGHPWAAQPFSSKGLVA